jgi:hypothetical protein
VIIQTGEKTMEDSFTQNNLIILQNVPAEVIQVVRWLKKARWRDDNRPALKHFHIEDLMISASDGLRMHQAKISYPKFPDGVYDITIAPDRMLILHRLVSEKNLSKTFAKTIQDSLDYCITVDAGKATKKLEVYTRLNPRLLAEACSIPCEGLEMRIGAGAIVLRGVKSMGNFEATRSDIALTAMIMPLHVKDGGAWIQWRDAK